MTHADSLRALFGSSVQYVSAQVNSMCISLSVYIYPVTCWCCYYRTRTRASGSQSVRQRKCPRVTTDGRKQEGLVLLLSMSHIKSDVFIPLKPIPERRGAP